MKCALFEKYDKKEDSCVKNCKYFNMLSQTCMSSNEICKELFYLEENDQNKESRLAQKIYDIFRKKSDDAFSIEVEVEELSKRELKITLTNMYEYVDITFDHLDKLSKLLKTKNINIGEHDCTLGCETCDYGSRYWVELYAKNVKYKDKVSK